MCSRRRGNRKKAGGVGVHAMVGDPILYQVLLARGPESSQGFHTSTPRSGCGGVGVVMLVNLVHIGVHALLEHLEVALIVVVVVVVVLATVAAVAWAAVLSVVVGGRDVRIFGWEFDPCIAAQVWVYVVKDVHE